ncbi:MAG: type II toxin-antitoxin system HicA family toxin [Desulforhabdus sp.]|jgi:predicted RNA binding protein YcfA (HicA-like mRNA interferase family)|nr:type II toxin-antitoxin system HicA family toxin [Desulforhabdus sp.]
MSEWPSKKARRALAALHRIGWQIKRSSGSHRTLSCSGWSDFVFSFYDNEELGRHVLSRIARRTGLKPKDL